MPEAFRTQLGESVKLLVGVLTVLTLIVSVALSFAALSERLSLVEAKADDHDASLLADEKLLIEMKDMLWVVRQDVAVIKQVLVSQ